MARRHPLDGPGMGYGLPQRENAKGVTVPTLVLGLLCVLLALALALALAGRRDSAAASPAVTVTVTAAPATATAAPVSPAQAAAVTTATTFVRAWREPNVATRTALLHQVAAEPLAAQLVAVPAARIPKSTPVAGPVVTLGGETTATADQRLSDNTTMRMQLVFDSAAQYGWVVQTAVQA
jgi:hypothetical protein